VFPGIDPLVARKGDRVRIRIANMSMHDHPIHIHGFSFTVTETEGGRLVDPQGNPVPGATLRTTVSNETTATSQDTAVVTIPKALVPADGHVTVFADLESSFLHGRTDVNLGADFNPSITVNLKAARDATVAGQVQDDGILRTGCCVVVGGIHARHGQFGSVAVDDPDAAAAQRIQIRTACDEGHLIAGMREPGSQVTADRSDPDDRYLQ
jgi:hypothetical protein